jgi:hypothetical protein
MRDLRNGEAGTFRLPSSASSGPRVEARAADLVMLLDGIDLYSAGDPGDTLALFHGQPGNGQESAVPSGG